MHTVPRGYLAAFAATMSGRREPALWRFDRTQPNGRLVGLNDAEVAKDIYTIEGGAGLPSGVIERPILTDAEGGFCTVRESLQSGRVLLPQDYHALARFLGYQFVRTPRSLQVDRDELRFRGIPFADDAPQQLMVALTVYVLEPWLCKMFWTIGDNRTGVPLITSDHPVTPWKETPERPGVETGVGFGDRALQIYCPISPTMAFIAKHTPESLDYITGPSSPAGSMPTLAIPSLDRRTMPPAEVRQLNMACVTNAERHVYSNTDNIGLRDFLVQFFIGKPAPVRRRDGKPPGSAA